MIEVYDGGTLKGSYPTIQDAVNAAAEGDTIRIPAGVYAEAVTVDKALNFEGDPNGGTVMDGGGLLGSGLHLVGDLGDDEKVEIEGITFQNYINSGVRFDDDAVLKELKIEDSAFLNNGINGVRIGGDYDPVALEKFEIKDSNFESSGNGTSNGDGDILAFQFYGDAKIEDVTITGGGTGDNAIQFRGDDGPIGKVEIKDVTIDGGYAKTGIAVYNYDDGDGLKFKDVEVTAVTGWGLPLNVDNVGGKVDAKGFDTSGAPGRSAVQGDEGDNDLKADKDSASVLNGKGGDDKIKGSDQDDLVLAGDGVDKIDAKKGDDVIDAGAGDDNVKAGDGDDGIVGGEGDDDIDGGKGYDTAIYSGSIDDYELDFKGKDKVNVTDTREVGGDGADKLKKVELLIFTNGTEDTSDDVYVDVATQTVFVDEIEYRFDQGFEVDTAGIRDGDTGWYGAVYQVASGTNGIESAEGGFHAVLENADPLPFPGFLGGGYTGPFTNWGGYEETNWIGSWTTEVDIYLDADDNGGGWAAGEGFDFSSAVSAEGGGHLRDFIFHVTQDSSTGELLVNASNNTNFAPREDLDTLAGTAQIDADGWYTFQQVFYDDGGSLAVDMNVLDEDGDIVFTKTINSGDDIDTEVAGNRYGWFTTISVDEGIEADNFQLNYADEQVFDTPTVDDYLM